MRSLWRKIKQLSGKQSLMLPYSRGAVADLCRVPFGVGCCNCCSRPGVGPENMGRRADESGPKSTPIQLSPEHRQLIGLQIATVEEKELSGRVDTTGLVEPDEQLEGYVQTRFSGWIRQVLVNQTYQFVKRGEPLFTIYSPDLVSTENELLIALQSQRQLGKSSVQGVAEGADQLVSGARDRLKQFGVPEREIQRLERQGTTRDAVEIDSPMTGYVVERNALPNMYVQPETKLYSITTLSNIWVYAAVFQNQIGLSQSRRSRYLSPSTPIQVEHSMVGSILSGRRWT